MPLFSRFAGVFVDRWPRRPLTIAANLVRSLALVSLPFALVIHHIALAGFSA